MKTLSGAYDPLSGPEYKDTRTEMQRNQDRAIDVARRGQGIRRSFNSTGALRQEGDIVTDTTNRINSVLATLAGTERQNKLNTAADALSLGQYETQEPLQKAQAAQQYGGLERIINAGNLEAMYNEWTRQETAKEQALSASLAASNAGQPIYGQTSVQQPGIFQQLLGAAVPALAYGAGAGMLSNGASGLFSNYFAKPSTTGIPNLYNPNLLASLQGGY